MRGRLGVLAVVVAAFGLSACSLCAKSHRGPSDTGAAAEVDTAVASEHSLLCLRTATAAADNVWVGTRHTPMGTLDPILRLSWDGSGGGELNGHAGCEIGDGPCRAGTVRMSADEAREIAATIAAAAMRSEVHDECLWATDHGTTYVEMDWGCRSTTPDTTVGFGTDCLSLARPDIGYSRALGLRALARHLGETRLPVRDRREQ